MPHSMNEDESRNRLHAEGHQPFRNRGADGGDGSRKEPSLTCFPHHFIIFTISRHSFAQFVQDFAQAVIFSSSENFSHAAAHCSQHFAQHSAAGPESSL
jgi:hypothetical protein